MKNGRYAAAYHLYDHRSQRLSSRYSDAEGKSCHVTVVVGNVLPGTECNAPGCIKAT